MKELTLQEEKVMLLIWQLKECIVKDILHAMDEPKPPYTTLASVVRNLEAKGYLNAKKYANVYVYTPRITEQEYKETFMSNVVKNYFKDSYKELVSFFAKEEKISAKELKEIIALIEKNKK